MVEWRECIQNPSYLVSDAGQIRRIGGNVLRPAIRAGYARVTLGGRYFYVHQLVATAFLGVAPTRSHQVAHFDGVRSNNAASNLRWATPAENNADKRRHGTSGHGERNAMAVLRDAEIKRMRELRKDGIPRGVVALLFGVTPTYVSHVTAGRSRQHSGPVTSHA